MVTVQLYLFSDNGLSVSDNTVVTSHVIEETVATVLSSITGSLRIAANDGCSIDLINEARVREPIPNSGMVIQIMAIKIRR